MKETCNRPKIRKKPGGKKECCFSLDGFAYSRLFTLRASDHLTYYYARVLKKIYIYFFFLEKGTNCNAQIGDYKICPYHS